MSSARRRPIPCIQVQHQHKERAGARHVAAPDDQQRQERRWQQSNSNLTSCQLRTRCTCCQSHSTAITERTDRRDFRLEMDTKCEDCCLSQSRGRAPRWLSTHTCVQTRRRSSENRHQGQVPWYLCNLDPDQLRHMSMNSSQDLPRRSLRS